MLIAEHERAFGKYRAVLTLVHFIDRLSYVHRDVVLAEVDRRRRFYHSLQSLLDGYVENNMVTASKRFLRVVALLEDHTMQDVYDAIDHEEWRCVGNNVHEERCAFTPYIVSDTY
jgi:hypothetical protein